MIGYPGQDKIVIGCRGFLRAEICIHGKAAHSGSSREHGVNAITRAVELAQNLQKAPLSQVTTREFHLPPQLTITSIRGGIGDSSVPDLCRMRLDIRLTPTYDAEAAKKTIEEPGWPAYVVPHDHPMVQALWQSAREVLNKEVLRKVAGPSSVGNLLALRGIPATAGFGVIYQNAHGTNERILVESLQPVYECYLNAVRALLRD
jgi:succinyl-diaminopimelate desuccinylase